jgi:outer membrane protein assembly factor BamB
MKHLLTSAILGLCVVVSACSAIPKPGPVRPQPDILLRGWVYSEPEADTLKLETGVQPLTFSSPIIHGEKVIYGTNHYGVIAVHKTSGRMLWQRQWKSSISANPFVLANKVFIGDEEGQLHALDLQSGRELWTVSLSQSAVGSPTVAEDKLLVATVDESLHALDPGTGKLLWTYKRPVFTTTSIKGGGNPSYISGRIWMGFSDGSLLALDPNDGAVVMEKQFRDNIKFTDIDAKTIAWRDGMLMTTYDGKLRYLKKDASIIWEFNAGGARAPYISPLDSEVIYLPSSEGTLYALRQNKELWRYSINKGVPTGVVMVKSNSKMPVLALTTSDRQVILLDPLTGKELAKDALGQGSGSYGNLVADEQGNSFYVLSQFSRLYQFNVRL